MGKQTAFDTDIHVPLIVAGPGVPAGQGQVSRSSRTSTSYPTFVQLAGGTPAHAGRRPQPRAAAARPRRARRGAPSRSSSTRAATTIPPIPTSKVAAATRRPTKRSGSRRTRLPHFDGPVEAVYVEYADPQHEIEFYDIAKDPYEIDNIASGSPAQQRAELHSILGAYETCHDANACWTAGKPS